MKTQIDVFIKNEGYADFRFISERSKEVAHKLGIPNSLKSFGDTWCGQPVWNSKNKTGRYKCGINLDSMGKIVLKLQNEGLTIESEF